MRVPSEALAPTERNIRQPSRDRASPLRATHLSQSRHPLVTPQALP
jgi:hypothetical protein